MADETPEQPSNRFTKAQRDNQIVSLKARGMTNEAIATVVGLSKTQVINIINDWRATEPNLREQDPLTIIDDALRGYQADLAELATVSSATKNEAVRVGAINARMAARDRIIALLQAVGVLPHDLGKLRIEVDVRYLSTRVLAIFDKYKMPDAAREELLDLLEQADEAAPALSRN